MKLRRSTKVLLPLAMMVVVAWVTSNVCSFEIQIATAVELGFRSQRGYIAAWVTTGPGAYGYVYYYRYRDNDRLRLLRTSFLPSFGHTRLVGPSGAATRERYRFSVPYWYLLDAVVLLWLAMWWRGRRRDAKSLASAHPQAA